VQLHGGSPNTIVFSNPNPKGYAPGLDNITVWSGANTSPIITAEPRSFEQEDTVTITDTTPGAAIYYTTDGTTPTAYSSLYTEPFDVKINKTIKAIAIASGYPDSDIASKMLSLAHDPHDPNSAQLHQDSVH
jgi:hypothetical protein